MRPRSRRRDLVVWSSSAGLILIAGMLIMLRGVAVTLGVSEPRRPDFYGFGTRPHL